jgi:ABC-type bacteriocin/lantibiotic exporter with double-glycine peptidase domain
VIGESGGGKSTFLKLVRDLYKPQKLNLTVDGKKD